MRDLLTAVGQFFGMIGLALLMVLLMCGAVMTAGTVVNLWISRHSASTQDAPAFSEARFSQVTVGMDAPEVKALVGGPLNVVGKRDGSQEWWYTMPKEPLEGWGTWDARILTVSKGIVIEVTSRKLPNH